MPDLDEIFPVRKGKLGIIDAVISQVFDACWEEVTKKEEEKGKHKICKYIIKQISTIEMVRIKNFLSNFLLQYFTEAMARLDVDEVEISSFTESLERFVQVYAHNSNVFAVNDCGSIFAFNSEGTDSY